MTHFTANKISVDPEVLEQARAAIKASSKGAHLFLRLDDGTQKALPGQLEVLLLKTLDSLTSNGQVTVRKIPEELTSTAAADLLGVSRPTLIKWAQTDQVDWHKVGTHFRFKRQDILALKERRQAERLAAFEELRALDAEFELNEEPRT